MTDNDPVAAGESTNPTCFISYSRDDEQHQCWVIQLATDLREKGVDVILDVWDTALGDDLVRFMESSVRESEFVLMICTPEYKRKADAGKGGVGYEKKIVTGEIFNGVSRPEKFVPVLRSGMPKEALPSFMLTDKRCDMTNNEQYASRFNELLLHIYRKSMFKKPPLGAPPDFDDIVRGSALGTIAGEILARIGLFRKSHPGTDPEYRIVSNKIAVTVSGVPPAEARKVTPIFAESLKGVRAREKWTSFLHTGRPIEFEHGEIDGIEHFLSELTGRIPPPSDGAKLVVSAPIPPIRVDCALSVKSDGKVLELACSMWPRFIGQNEMTMGIEDSRGILKLEIAAGAGPASVSFDLNCANRTADDVLKVIEFLISAESGDVFLHAHIPGGGVGVAPLRLGIFRLKQANEELASVLQLVNTVRKLNEFYGAQLSMPDEITEQDSDIGETLLFAIDNGRYPQQVTSVTMEMGMPLIENLVRVSSRGQGAIRIAGGDEQFVPLFGQQISLGQQEVTIESPLIEPSLADLSCAVGQMTDEQTFKVTISAAPGTTIESRYTRFERGSVWTNEPE